MKLGFSHRSLFIGILLTALSAAPLQAQTSPAPSASDDAAKPAPSSGVADVLKMLDAHVSADVIKTYIETSPASFEVSPTDLIALKDKGVTDDISMALLKHSSTAAAPAAPASAAPAATADAPHPIRAYIVNTGVQDPESYEFFEHYYLMPRTQAYVNQTLGYPSVPYGDTFAPYYPPVYGYGYAYSPGIVVGTGFGGRNAFSLGRNFQGGFGIRR